MLKILNVILENNITNRLELVGSVDCRGDEVLSALTTFQAISQLSVAFEDLGS